MLPDRFTYPFRYVPRPEIVRAAERLIAELDSPGAEEKYGEAVLRDLRAGKMMGVLMCAAHSSVSSSASDTDGEKTVFLYGFSGTAGGTSNVQGFVPPILDITEPNGYFKRREAEISAMPAGPEKSAASAGLQEWLFENYVVRNALAETASIRAVFAARGLTPPGGTGECAAPKLLQEAYRLGLKPLAMGEFWYGISPKNEVREQGRFYPSCTGKCGPLLTWMMRGLDVEPNPLDEGYTATVEPHVIYEDSDIIVVDKPAGMLSVPGRTSAPSLLGWLRSRYGEGVESCHRLDMDTSGIMVFARSKAIKAIIEAQFAERKVSKTYRSRLVSGNTPFRHARKGTLALPLALDYYDRPRQTVDYVNGKKAVTEYEVLAELPDGSLEVRFRPLTGRSHQIRVHAAHAAGLGRPIKGDALYGAPDAGRLWLHAESISFTHPSDGRQMHFEAPL